MSKDTSSRTLTMEGDRSSLFTDAQKENSCESHEITLLQFVHVLLLSPVTLLITIDFNRSQYKIRLAMLNCSFLFYSFIWFISSLSLGHGNVIHGKLCKFSLLQLKWRIFDDTDSPFWLLAGQAKGLKTGEMIFLSRGKNVFVLEWECKCTNISI